MNGDTPMAVSAMVPSTTFCRNASVEARAPRGLAHAVGNPLGEQPAITDGLDAKAITDLEARVVHRHLGQSDAPLAPDPGFPEARGRRSAGMPRRLGWGREDSNLRRLSRCV